MKSFLSCEGPFGGDFKTLVNRIITYTKTDSVTSFPVCISFISFSCFIVITNTSSSLLTGVGIVDVLASCWSCWELLELFSIKHAVAVKVAVYRLYGGIFLPFPAFQWLHHWRIMSFCHRLFLCLMRWLCDFYLWVYVIDNFFIICIEPSLLCWNEAKLVMKNNDSDKSLNSVSH